MLDRMVTGQVADKPHTALRDEAGRLRHEECLTREGFDGPFTILYHVDRPHVAAPSPGTHGWEMPNTNQRTLGGSFASPADEHRRAGPAVAHATTDNQPRPLARRHYRSQALPRRGGPPIDARAPLLFSDDLVVSILHPDAPDPVYFSNGDGDDLFFVLEGGGLLRSALGDLNFETNDYVFVPKGLLHRFIPTDGPQAWLSIECAAGFGLPAHWRNGVGQLRMDAPYSHRDFRRPVFGGPRDEGLRELVVKRAGAFHGFRYPHAPLDVVGWDGAVYPWAFPILRFAPRVGLTHLPPTVHGTFTARGALISSFVPRPLDFHPQAIPCPYPHASVDCDEILFYCAGSFTSRRGVGVGSLSHHPAGIIHGPHPGAYEGSLGARATDELAVMLDTTAPLEATRLCRSVEDPDYHASFA